MSSFYSISNNNALQGGNSANTGAINPFQTVTGSFYGVSSNNSSNSFRPNHHNHSGNASGRQYPSRNNASHANKRPLKPFDPNTADEDEFQFPFFCHVCDKGFKTSEKLEQHEHEDHMPCPEIGCNYSAPIELLEIHKMRHSSVTEKGTSVLDDPTEIEKWVAARRANFPRRNKSDTVAAQQESRTSDPRNCCAIERMIRTAMRTATGKNAMTMSDTGRGGLNASTLGMKGSRLPMGDYENLLNSTKIGGKPICRHFFQTGRCKFQKMCRNAHVRPGDDCLEGTTADLLRPRRLPLLMQLLNNDVEAWEGKIGATLRFLVDSDFLKKSDSEIDNLLKEEEKRKIMATVTTDPLLDDEKEIEEDVSDEDSVDSNDEKEDSEYDDNQNRKAPRLE